MGNENFNAGAVVPARPCDIAQGLIANGYRPVPCEGKRVQITGWTSREFTEWDFDHRHNVGIKTGDGIALVDIDVSDPDASAAIVAEWQRRHPGAPQRTGKAPKTAFLVGSDLASKIDLKLPDLGKDEDGKDQKIEVLASGQQFVAYGVHPDTGNPYHWHGLDPLDTFLGAKDALPVVSEAELREFVQWVKETYGPKEQKKPKLSQRAANAAGIKIDPGSGSGEFWRAVKDAALEHTDLWVPTLFPSATKHATGAWRVASADLGRDLEEDISIHPDGIQDFGEEQPRTALDLVQVFGGAQDAKAAAFWLCEKMGIEPTALGWQKNKKHDKPKNGTNEIDLTEDGVALHFTAKFSDKLRFDHDQGRWFQWTGDHWKPDGTHLAYSFCRQIARELSEGTPDKDRKTVRKAAFAAGVERMARSDRAHAVTSEQWDTDPFLLGCPGVTIDLRTGQHLRPDPVNGITRQAAVAPAKTDCPLWIRFLTEVCESDPEMIRFLQQWSGYCLTGDTREHALLFVYGPGGNGKSVFLETMAHILGDYATTSSMDTFTASKSDRHPTDLAMLRGARMVSASETEEGRAWAESRIKQLTGGDQITARFMRQDFFTYTPQFKLTVVGNHKPVLRNVDDAARRRFNIVPFTVKPKTPDPELVAKLKAEAPAILQWMIEGCLDWRRNGLVRPRKVLDATAEYFDDQDLFGQWLEEACRVEPENQYLTATPKELFEAWSTYALAAGEQPGTQTALGNALNKRGLAKRVRKIGGKATRVWHGISLHRPDVEAWQDRD